MIVTDGVTISANTAAGTGGGICCLAPTAGADLLITESAVTGNTAGTGGGIYLLTNFGGAVTTVPPITAAASGSVTGVYLP